jgi:hypothetical protein
MKFPMELGIVEVRDDQIPARKCSLTSLKDPKAKTTLTVHEVEMTNEQKLQPVEPAEELTSVLVDKDPSHLIQVGSQMTEKHKKQLVEFLRKKTETSFLGHTLTCLELIQK